MSSLTPHPTQYRSFRRRSSQLMTCVLRQRGVEFANVSDLDYKQCLLTVLYA